MFTKIPFYHGVTRKATVAFGALFSNMFIVTKGKTKKSEKIVKVPLSYVAKDKFIVRLNQADPELRESTQITLPRASFEIVGYTYDGQRKLNKIHKLKGESENGDFVVQYTPVPYNISFNLYTYTKSTEDDLQLMEQILPYFGPDMTLAVIMQEQPEIRQDIPLILESVTKEDDYDGSFEDRRMIITTYSFQMKVNYYGPLKGISDPENHFEDDGEAPIIKRVIVNVGTNGEANKYRAEINPFEANPGDLFTIDESWEYISPRDFDEDKRI